MNCINFIIINSYQSIKIIINKILSLSMSFFALFFLNSWKALQQFCLHIQWVLGKLANLNIEFTIEKKRRRRARTWTKMSPISLHKQILPSVYLLDPTKFTTQFFGAFGSTKISLTKALNFAKNSARKVNVKWKSGKTVIVCALRFNILNQIGFKCTDCIRSMMRWINNKGNYFPSLLFSSLTHQDEELNFLVVKNSQ